MKEEGNIYYGEAANVSNCRNIASTATLTGVDQPNHTAYMQLLKAAIRQPIHVLELSQPHQQEHIENEVNISDEIQGEHDDEEFILWGPARVELDFHYDDEDDGETGMRNDKLQIGQLVITSQQLIFWMDAISGSTEASTDSISEASFLYEYDLRVDATCIDLHALTSSNISSSSSSNNNNNDDDDELNADVVEEYSNDNKAEKFQDADDEDVSDNNKNSDDGGVYVQLSHGDNEDDEGDDQFQELTFRIIQPTENHPQQKIHTSHTLFAAISKLIAMHPIDPNDDNNNHGDAYNCPTMGSTSTPTMWFGEGPIMTADGTIQLPTYDINENDIAIDKETDEHYEEDGADEFIVAPPRQPHNTAATYDNDNDLDDEQQQERNAMLERLDRLLIIPPEYEYPDEDNELTEDIHQDSHQFDDADTDDSDNDLL
jgi:hypothetical protein